MQKPLQFNLRTLFLATALIALWAAVLTIAKEGNWEFEFANVSLGFVCTGWFVFSYREFFTSRNANGSRHNFKMFLCVLGMFIGAPLAILFFIGALLRSLIRF